MARRFPGDYFFEAGLDVVTRGQATMRTALKAAGAEPDKSCCIGEEKEWPDLVLEIALTSGGVQKLELYRRFEVPEVLSVQALISEIGVEMARWPSEKAFCSWRLRSGQALRLCAHSAALRRGWLFFRRHH